jgi:hypothetical protein
MCFFCDCKHSHQWRSSVDQKLDMILQVVSEMTHISPADREYIRATTAQLKANTQAANAAIAANQPTQKGEGGK